MKRFGIFGGTFDPIHVGHLVCAEQLREAVDLDLVVFMPCSMPPHKPGYVPVAPEHRIRMAELATSGYADFAVSDIEATRGGISYTIDTVRQIRKSFGDDTEMWLLMGMDTYLDIPTWKQPEEIIAECSLAVALRPGFRKRLPAKLQKARTRFVEITGFDISSTDIRSRLSLGRSIRFLVPDTVEEYIRSKSLYVPASRK